MRRNKVFNSDMELIKAGGIILRPGSNGQEILMVAGKNRDFSFPKGHVEPGETIEDTAVREVKEETGLEVKILKKLPDLKYRNKETKDQIRVYLYLMETVGGKLTPEHKYNVLKWIPAERVSDFTRFRNIANYAQKIGALQ